MVRQSTVVEFEKKINKIFPNLLIKGKYVGNNSHILVGDKYGDYKVFPSGLLRGMHPSIKACTNKTKYFINKSSEIHKNKYIYTKTKYKGSEEKLTITCPIHGDFIQKANTHILGSGCPKCGIETIKNKVTLTTEEFVLRSINKHQNKYNYEKCVYTHGRTKVPIICPKHGIFYQTPEAHLQGQGCPKCKNSGFGRHDFIEKAKGRTCFCYIIKCYNDEEEFIKIGITSRPIEKRFDSKIDMPYKYKIIKLYEGSSEYVYNKENELHKLHIPYKYLPKMKFIGMYECFTKTII